MKVVDFVFHAHRDRNNREECRFSHRTVPYDTPVHLWGRVDKANCPYCGAHVEVYESSHELAVDHGAD
jgi:hypothetical protein